VRSVEEHLAACLACLEGVAPLSPREVPLLDALGLELAEAVDSPIDLPRFDNSAMDGYAVRTSEVSGATPDSPRILPVLGDIAAGSPAETYLEPGATLRIMTGAPLPEGADAVVPVEWTDGGVTSVRISGPPVRGQYVRPIGDDVSAGERVLTSGTRLAARHLALLAAVGYDQVRVVPRPRVVVLPSGSELVPPGKPLGPGQIHDSNSYGLIAAARAAGADAEHGGLVDDEASSVSTLLSAAAGRADLLITTGGVSMGAYDTVKEVLSGTGTVWFGKVAMQPGSPQGLGTYRGTPIITLPGNPVSAMVSFEVFVRPMLQHLAGAGVDRTWHRVVVAEGWRSPAGKRQFTRVVHASENGRTTVRPIGGQGSHLVADLAHANGLVAVPEDVTSVEPGTELEMLPL
jgi:molybdopterin molybdotransferase